MVIRERTDDQAEHWSPLPTGQNRDSVRITSHALYSGGLFLIDLALMPWGCGVWPACKSRLTESRVSCLRETGDILRPESQESGMEDRIC